MFDKYPSIKFVYGNLDDGSVIEKTASEAAVVLPMFSFLIY